jgi:NADPH:quinone reductase-like Zn-dependent oxidoreductase
MATMRAVWQTQYGPPGRVLEVRELPVPEPRRGEVRVRVRASCVHADVWHVVNGQPALLRLMGAGLRRPNVQVPGADVAGVVETAGARFQVGDQVFGDCLAGMQWKNGGAFAEQVTVAEELLAPLPSGVSFEEAATVPTGGYIALTNLRGESAVRPGMNVLINGAGGGVGTAALQICRDRGAVVTAVDRAEKLEWLRELGAAHTVDYAREDCTRSDRRYELIVDVASTLELDDCKRVLSPGGKYLMIGHDHYGKTGKRLLGSVPRMVKLMARSAIEPAVPKGELAQLPKPGAIAELERLLRERKLRPKVAARFPLEQAAEAFALLASGTAIGSVVLVP